MAVLDTRNKIIEFSRAERLVRERIAAGTPVKLVSGHFDPLLAGHARRLAEIAADSGKLTVCVASPEKPLLEAPARALLVAALDVVEYTVVTSPGELDQLLALVPLEMVTREEPADTRRTEELIQHVQRRHTA